VLTSVVSTIAVGWQGVGGNFSGKEKPKNDAIAIIVLVILARLTRSSLYFNQYLYIIINPFT
jgi:hypothetical protein